MSFTEGNTRYAIWFKYTRGVDGRMETVCIIDTEGTDETFAMGSSICAKSDQFVKSKGREIALERALKNAIAKGKRDDFWRAAMSCYSKRAEARKEKVAA